jgi:adenine-specific DNA-methyltransferase
MSSLELFSINWRDLWQGAETSESVGAVFTRPEIIDLILDLADYSPTAGALSNKRILEPSCGDGAFLEAIVTRLIASELRVGKSVDWCSVDLDSAIRAADINPSSIDSARALIQDRLISAGCPFGRARQLAEVWTVHTDFLLQHWDFQFSLVVGNPPYVRLEDLPRPVLDHYRKSFSTATDRADLYVAFIQRGLQLLSPDGILAFICANRFAKNQYGASLRKHIADCFHVRHFINLEHTQPFLEDVSAYPSIVVIDRDQGQPTFSATLDDLSTDTLNTVRREVLGGTASRKLVSRFRTWYKDGSPWRTTEASEYDFLLNLESGYPALEDSALGTRVGIGVATGADDIFVLDKKHPCIEESRQIPLLMTQDVRLDAPDWSGHYLINPFAPEDDGSLVSLEDFPGLAQYLTASEGQLRKRHVAAKRPVSWFRTIDRIWPKLQFIPKLIIPDIQSGGVVGLDPGKYYLHHNLYWVTSESWPLRALQAILRSTFVLRQVRAYSVQMRGGSLRYQAQTLRRLRIPAASDLPVSCMDDLCSVATSTDQNSIDVVVAAAYGCNPR